MKFHFDFILCANRTELIKRHDSNWNYLNEYFPKLPVQQQSQLLY